jgi:mono/diheme cytochrome c family protein
MKTTIKYILPVAALLIMGCSNDSESDLTDTIDQDTPVSYNGNIRSIINSNCLGCHSDPTKNGAPFPLTDYDRVLVRAENGQLLRSIKRQTGEASAMPPSGRLPQATIDLVERWIQEGSKE